MRLFVILFAIFAVILFFALALKRGSQNRRDIENIEKAERASVLNMSEEEKEILPEKASSGIIGSFAGINNSVGRTLKCLGIIIIFAGTIISFCSAEKETGGSFSLQYGFSFLRFFACELITCFAGFLSIGLGEIIKLLDDIRQSLRNR